MTLDIRPPLSAALAAFGVAGTVTVAGEEPVETTVLWSATDTVEVPVGGGDYKRVEERRVMSIAKADVPRVPMGTLVTAPEYSGAADRTWKVDAIQHEDFDHIRAVMVEVAT